MIDCFTRVVTAVRAIVSQVTFTELGLYTHTLTRTIVQFCTYGLATVNPTETIEASVEKFFFVSCYFKTEKSTLFYLNESVDKKNHQREEQ